jgi:hypothetical protein
MDSDDRHQNTKPTNEALESDGRSNTEHSNSKSNQYQTPLPLAKDEKAKEEVQVAPRPDLIQSAVSFLSSPNVVSAPLAKKVSFLKDKKGLTDKEIQIALERVDSSTSSSTIPPPPPSIPTASKPPVSGHINQQSYSQR